MEITIENILSTFTGAKDTKKMAELKRAVMTSLDTTELSLFDNIDKAIEKC